MIDFQYYIPTRVIFGRDSLAQVGVQAARLGKKALVHYGGKSAVASGLLDQTIALLQESGLETHLLGGVVPNPRLSLVREGIDLCRREGIDVIIAIGGGSVIDSAKAIAIGVPYSGDVWDFFEGKVQAENCLPIGAVLTIPAAGSETSKSIVITDETRNLKRSCASEIARPKFAIMNPQWTLTLPWEQTANGIVDILAHMMERYFTPTPDVTLTDFLGAAAQRAVIGRAMNLLSDPNNYNARADMMWAGSIAHSDFLSNGRVGDWGCHQIEHELSGVYDIAHGAGLSIVFPAWMKYVYTRDIEQFARYAHDIWDMPESGDRDAQAREGIARLEAFYQKIGRPTRLSQIGIDDSQLAQIAENTRKVNGDGTLGKFIALDSRDVEKILRLAL